MDVDFFRSKVKENILRGRDLLSAVQRGDFSRVCCDMSGKYDGGGRYDINSKNRLLLARFLMWQDVLHDNAENLLSILFTEEISALRQDSFQGFGDGLTILTTLLCRYNDDGKYDGLFQQAKNANFDTFCGYEPDSCEKILSENIDEMSPIDCIYFLADLGLYDESGNLADKYTEDNPPFTDSDYKMLISINNFTGRKQQNLPYYKALADTELERENPWGVSLALSDLIRAYIDIGEYDKAYIAMGRAREYLFKVSEWNECGLGRDYFEYAAELVCAMPEKAEIIWEEWRYFSVKSPDNMSVDCLKKHICAANAVCDFEAAEIFQNVHDKVIKKQKRSQSYDS